MSKEQNKTALPNDAAKQTEAGAGKKYTQSTIEFPYNDLDSAVMIAKAINDNAGTSCTLDQLAAYLKQSMTSGAFRLRVSNARIFGVTENERGEVRLTPLGRAIADPAQEAAARVEAFLTVPLYARIYENYKGYTLPPAAALEKFMVEVGVAPKLTGKARQAFMRSARQAGFFVHGEDRLVRPAIGPGTKPIDTSEPEGEETDADDEKKGGGGGGPGDPLIRALIQKLPPPGDEWPAEARVNWLQMISMAFQMAYGPTEPIEIKKAE